MQKASLWHDPKYMHFITSFHDETIKEVCFMKSKSRKVKWIGRLSWTYVAIFIFIDLTGRLFKVSQSWTTHWVAASKFLTIPGVESKDMKTMEPKSPLFFGGKSVFNLAGLLVYFKFKSRIHGSCSCSLPWSYVPIFQSCDGCISSQFCLFFLSAGLVFMPWNIVAVLFWQT